MGAGEDFDAILEEIWGSGKYQKRLTLVLLGNLFFLMPFALLVQMFVLTIPGKLGYPPGHLGLQSVTFNPYVTLLLP